MEVYLSMWAEIPADELVEGAYPSTISSIFHQVLLGLLPLYKANVCPPTDAIPKRILKNLDTLKGSSIARGAIDGIHIFAKPRPTDYNGYRNRKVTLTQNVLNFYFFYSLQSWEGSMHDGRVFVNALRDDGLPSEE